MGQARAWRLASKVSKIRTKVDRSRANKARVKVFGENQDQLLMKNAWPSAGEGKKRQMSRLSPPRGRKEPGVGDTKAVSRQLG